jgi:hypothetical protein
MLSKPFSSICLLALSTTSIIAISPAIAHAGGCVVVGNTAICDASGNQQSPGSGGGKTNGNGNGNNTGPNAGCQNQGQAVPGQGCTQGAPAAVQVIPPVDLAAQARTLLGPLAPTLNWSPQPRSYVQLRTALWLNNGDFTVYQKSLTDPTGTETVTVRASPKFVDWDLREGTTRCTDGGSQNDTKCGYSYKRSSVTPYHIKATITWGVTWQCTVGCAGGGTLKDIPMTGEADLPIGEIQTASQP